MRSKKKRKDAYETQQLPAVPTDTQQLTTGRATQTTRDTGTAQPSTAQMREEQLVVPLAQEDLSVAKKWVQNGEVVLRKTVRTRTETLPVDLEYEEVQIDRVPINRALAYGEQITPRQEGDTLIIPVVEEELVVSKRLVLREEIHVRKQRLSRHQEVSDKVRSQHLDIETTGDLGASQEGSNEPR